jgi:hypothetical protein
MKVLAWADDGTVCPSRPTRHLAAYEYVRREVVDVGPGRRR